MGKVSVTFEYNSVEEAILDLGKRAMSGKVRRAAAKQTTGAPGAASSLSSVADQGAIPAGAPPLDTAPTSKPDRKQRSDKGQKREPYGPRQQSSEGGAASAAAPAAAASPEASATQEVAAPQLTTPGAVPQDGGAPVTREQAQKALEKLFETPAPKGGQVVCMGVLGRFGVKRLRDLEDTPANNAAFLKKCEDVLAGRPV